MHKPDACPKAIQALSGHTVSCIGFMYPLEAGSKIKEFCLLRSTQTCCYGPRPQFNQYLLVECRKPVSFERFAPIIVQGSLLRRSATGPGVYLPAGSDIRRRMPRMNARKLMPLLPPARPNSRCFPLRR